MRRTYIATRRGQLVSSGRPWRGETHQWLDTEKVLCGITPYQPTTTTTLKRLGRGDVTCQRCCRMTLGPA